MNEQTWKRILLVAGGIGLACSGLACPGRDLGPVTPVVQSGPIISIRQPDDAVVDLLVLVDNSNSMAQEQANLTAEFQILTDTLTTPRGDQDGDGLPDPTVGDLHIGVVSSDMGTGGFAVRTCDVPTGGDDGILQHESSPLVAGCADSYPAYLTFDKGDDAAQTAADFSCIATLGTGGCGFEQQLKAVRKALTTQRDGPNAGFLRDDSLLAILMVTDEEDCSVREDDPNATDIFDTTLGLGPLNLRCFNHPNYVEPVESFVQDILGLRPSEPDKLVIAAIVGIPPASRNNCNLTGMTDADFQCLLDLPEMQEVIDNSMEGKGQRLTPSCDEPGLGEAFPPRRIVEFVRQINNVGNNGIVRSICEADFSPAMQAITNLIQGKIPNVCLARPLEPRDEGRVQCIVRETLETSDECGPGRIDLGVSGGRRVCQICQEGDGTAGHMVDELGTRLDDCAAASGSYWRYLEQVEGCDTGRIDFVNDALPREGSDVNLECLSKIGEE